MFIYILVYKVCVGGVGVSVHAWERERGSMCMNGGDESRAAANTCIHIVIQQQLHDVRVSVCD